MKLAIGRETMRRIIPGHGKTAGSRDRGAQGRDLRPARADHRRHGLAALLPLGEGLRRRTPIRSATSWRASSARVDAGPSRATHCWPSLMPAIANMLLFVPWGFLAFVALDSPLASAGSHLHDHLRGGARLRRAMYSGSSYLPTRVTVAAGHDRQRRSARSPARRWVTRARACGCASISEDAHCDPRRRR